MGLFVFDHRLGDVDDLFGKRLRVRFRRARLGRGFRRRRLIGNRLLFFYFLFSLGFLCLFFLSKAQPGKEATFFLFCHLRPHSSLFIHGAASSEAEKMMKLVG